VRPLWLIVGPFLVIVLFAGLAVGKVWDRAACDSFTFRSSDWRSASTYSRLGERSAKWRMAQELDVCGTLDHDSRRTVLAQLGQPGSSRPDVLRWEVGDGGLLVVRLAGTRVVGVKGPS
jgi:hypothetical protein